MNFVHAAGYAINLDQVKAIGFETDGNARFYFDDAVTSYLAIDFGADQAAARDAVTKLVQSIDSAVFA